MGLLIFGFYVKLWTIVVFVNRTHISPPQLAAWVSSLYLDPKSQVRTSHRTRFFFPRSELQHPFFSASSWSRAAQVILYIYSETCVKRPPSGHQYMALVGRWSLEGVGPISSDQYLLWSDYRGLAKNILLCVIIV